LEDPAFARGAIGPLKGTVHAGERPSPNFGPLYNDREPARGDHL
jgi:hypothetical protein